MKRISRFLIKEWFLMMMIVMITVIISLFELF